MAVESWASNMQGNFDEFIRQSMRGSPRISDPSQQARDTAARRMNMLNNGRDSTAWPAPSPVAQAAAPATASAAPSNIQEMIAAQIGDGDAPIPSSAPRAADAGYDTRAEAIASNRDARTGPPVAQMGDASVAEMMQSQLPTQPGAINTAAGTPVEGYEPEQGANSVPLILMTIAALGGTAGVATLLYRFRNGDADAARTIQATGLPAETLEQFAGGGAGSAIQSGTPANTGMQPGDAQQQTARTPEVSKAQELPIAPDLDVRKGNTPLAAEGMELNDRMMSPQSYIDQLLAAEGIEANQPIMNAGQKPVVQEFVPENINRNLMGRDSFAPKKPRAAKNLPNSRPKAKPKVKAK